MSRGPVDDVTAMLAELEEMQFDSEPEDSASESIEVRHDLHSVAVHASAPRVRSKNPPRSRNVVNPMDQQQMPVGEQSHARRKRGRDLPPAHRDEYTPAPGRHVDLEEEARVIDVSSDEDDDDAEIGMILPHVIEGSANIYYKHLFKVINDMGNETTRLIIHVVLEKRDLSPPSRHKCTVWLENWTGYLVEHHYSRLGEIMDLRIGPGGAPERISASMCMMWEILRLKLILNYHRLRELTGWKIADSEFLVKWLLDTPGQPLEQPPIEPDAEAAKKGPKEKEEYERKYAKYEEEMAAFSRKKPLAQTPVLLMRQSQVRYLAQFVTSRIKVVPVHPDFTMLTELIMLKASMFFAQSMPGKIMDDPGYRQSMASEEQQIADTLHKEMEARGIGSDESEFRDVMADAVNQQTRIRSTAHSDRFAINMDYLCYCTCYFYPVMRREYYSGMFDRLSLTRADDPESYLPPGAVDRIKKWIYDRAKAQKEKYLERIEEVASHSMMHPGDAEWHTYRYPQESTSIAVVLRSTRGDHAYLDYHAQTGLSVETILNQVGVNCTSDAYVIDLFDRYLSTYRGTKWRDGYLIENGFIDEPETFEKITRTQEPLLINLASSYWLMLDKRVLPIYNVYVALGMWMVAIRNTRTKAHAPEDCLSDNVYIGDLIDSLVLGKETKEYITDTEKHRLYMDAKKRGLPVQTTHIKL